MTRVSRRDFVRLGAAGAAAVPLVRYPIPVHGADTRAQQVVERIRTSLGTEWRADTVDTFKAGDPSTVVSGIVTTSLATLDVMRRAVKAGANMIITSGPTFYSSEAEPRTSERVPFPASGLGSASLAQCLIARPPAGRDVSKAVKKLDSNARNLGLQDV